MCPVKGLITSSDKIYGVILWQIKSVSVISWSMKDIFNSQTSTKLTAGVVLLTLLLIMITATQFYQDRKQVKYGNVTSKPDLTVYI